MSNFLKDSWTYSSYSSTILVHSGAIYLRVPRASETSSSTYNI